LEELLRQLYALQQIDSNLDELEELKGDLPGEVRELEEKVEHMKHHIAELQEVVRDSFVQRDSADSEVVNFKDKVEKYKAQQFQVRNNKEYDALTKEMDGAVAMIAKLERDMEGLEGKAVAAKTDLEATQTQLAEFEKALAEKRESLIEVSKTTEEEERQQRHEREKVVARIKKRDLASYERIRNAKKGKAIVRVVRGACGGCFNAVPPQKILELRRNQKMYVCEHCGRILVSEEIAEGKTAKTAKT
jgi:uncharacterized protein